MEHKSHINYQALLDALKDKIRQARLRVNYSVNTELLKIYWEVGKTISDQENQEGWGKKVVDTLSKDLRSEFKDMKGLSPRNLRYMRDFAEAYPNFPFLQAAPAKSIEIERDKIDQSILQAPLAKLSWYHHITLLDKIKEPEERVFYIYKAIEMGWSRDVMVHQIEGGLHKRWKIHSKRPLIAD